MNAVQRMKLKYQIAVHADQFSKEAKKLGQAAANALGGRRRAQMTGLENVANSAMKVSDVWNYVKTRAARSNKGEDWRKNDLGKEMLDFLEKGLKTQHWRPICQALNFAEDTLEAQQVYLHLIRAFVHQVVVEYEYEVKRGEVTEGEKP